MTADERSSAGVPGPELRPPGTNPPPGLQPPGTHLKPIETTPGHHGLIWLALALVVVLGLGVLLLLPKLVSGPADPDTMAKQETVESPVQDSANSREDAEQAVQDFLQTRARLELANVAVWGEPEWGQATDRADRGNSHFTQRQFPMAAAAFTEALELLLLLESESAQRMADALESGWQALQDDNSASALGFFEIAKSIDDGSLEALDGLERARVRPDVLRLMTAGDIARSNNDLTQAQTAYLEAVALDGAYEPAEVALREVARDIEEIAFRDAMSLALSALGAEQVETAEAALRQAAGLRPDAEVVRNTQRELAQTKQRLWLEEQRQAAAKAESGEDWSSAVAIYRKVLERVPQAAFARQGVTFAGDRERLHRQLDHYLQDPTRVYSDQPRANAEKLLASAANPPAQETRLAEKVRRLQTLIIEATTPRTVTLKSDGLTSVQIYHVGRLGQFISQQLELRPGTYTVVGSRPGYRDVRQTLTVKPGAEQPPLEIRCEETV